MIGKRAEKTLNRAVRAAMERHHEYLTLEHVLWSLLEETSLRELVENLGADPAALQVELLNYLDREVPKVPGSPSGGGSSQKATGTSSDSGKSSENSSPEESEAHPVATPSIQRLIQRALFQVQSAGKGEIQPEDLFVALFHAKDSQALYLLEREGIERLDVVSYLSHGSEVSNDSESSGGIDATEAEETTGISGGGEQKQNPLEQYAVNLNERAARGKLDPLVGRGLELERMIQTLCRRRKNNPLLVGEAGVGKTALAEGLAFRIYKGEVPSLLADAVVFSLDLGSLLAGAKFRGDFEQRMKRVIQALEALREKGRQPILFIDEIHTVIGAGAVSGGTLDAANLLKPLLTRGEIQCIGSTTYAEYRSSIEKDHALARRFQKIDVLEPTQEEAIQILQGLKPSLEAHHQVQYTTEAIRAAVELSAKHITDRFLPDKAIDVLDEAGAKARLQRSIHNSGQSPQQQGSSHPEAPMVLGAEAIEAVVAQIARIPAKSVSTSQKSRLKSLEQDLKLSIFGQDLAIKALVAAIRMARSGLRSGDRPVGSFLFCGPTGVGKTELSRQLAHCLGVSFHRFDMSEYGEKHTVSRLIGAPPGYVGFDQAGLLTEAVIKNPHSVVLLDEIEKAHPDIWNVLLQVMDHGTLTDNNGRKADFRNVILILTSNVGSREMEKRAVGIASADPSTTAAQKAVEQTFSPEFRNRLDSIVYFNSLDPVTIAQVVGKQLVELESQLLARRVEIEFSPEVREWLAQKGYDRLMGARPMARLIQDEIKRQLADELLFGKLEHGGRVTVTLIDGKPHFEYLKKKKKTKKASGSSSEPSSEFDPVGSENLS